jgi:hypothetical protein
MLLMMKRMPIYLSPLFVLLVTRTNWTETDEPIHPIFMLKLITSTFSHASFRRRQ